MKHLTKRNFSAIATALAVALLATTPASLAKDETAQIKVIGTITPGSCGVHIDNNGEFNYGNISATTLKPTQANPLGTKTNNMQISCDGSTLVGISLIDNAESSAETTDPLDIGITHSINVFGLGFAPDGKTKIGGYRIDLDDNRMQIDQSTNLQSVFSDNKGQTWQTANPSGGSIFIRYPYRIISWRVKDQQMPLAGKTFLLPLMVTASIRPLSHLPSGRKMDMQGNATISLVYL